MSKQKNFMDFVPRRNKNYQYEVDKDGKVTILVKWTGPYHKIATVLTSPKSSRRPSPMRRNPSPGSPSS